MDGVRRHECPTISKRRSLTREPDDGQSSCCQAPKKDHYHCPRTRLLGQARLRDEMKASPRLARQPVSPTGLSLASFQPSQASRNGFG